MGTSRPRNINRIETPFLAAALLTVSLSATQAAVVTEGITFGGPQQSLNFTAQINNGSLNAQGSGSFGGSPLVLNPNPQSIPLAFSPSLSTFVEQPTASTAQVQIDNQSGRVVGLSDLTIDLFSGAIPTTHLQQVPIHLLIGGQPLSLPLDATFQFQQFEFLSVAAQTSGNSFVFTGMGYGLVDLNVSIAGIPLAHYFGTLGPPPLVTLTGTISTAPVPGSPHNENIILDGTGSVTVPFAVPTTVLNGSQPPFTFDGSVAANLPMTFAANFHLEADPVGAIVPEPTTALLFVIGAFATVIASARRGRR